jgi:Fe2+ transport system protein B
MPTVPCIITANKLDLRKARAPDQLRDDLSFMIGIPVIPTSALEGVNIEKALTSIVMLVVYEWSPLLRAFEEAGGKGFAALAKRLGLKEEKLKSYLRWFELRKMIAVDWEKGVVKLPSGITKLLGQWV